MSIPETALKLEFFGGQAPRCLPQHPRRPEELPVVARGLAGFEAEGNLGSLQHGAQQLSLFNQKEKEYSRIRGFRE